VSVHLGPSGWQDLDGTPAEVCDTLLIDLDGVVYVGPDAVPGAVDSLVRAARLGLTIAYVTNNAARTPETVAEHLSRLGVPAAAEQVVTSAQSAATLLARTSGAGAAVLVVGAEGLRAAIAAVGLRPVTAVADGPVAVVQGFSPETSWRHLLEACVAVRSGLRWVATNPDRTVPTERGIAPGNGALVEVVRATTGIEPEFAGKPFRSIFDEAIARTGAVRALVVGDRLDTDLQGARAADLPGLLVLTGVDGVRQLLRAPPERRPTLLGADLGDLFTAHRAPRPIPGGWCGGLDPEVTCRWTDLGGWLLAAPGTQSLREALEVVRVGCAALWGRGSVGGDDAAAGLLEAMAPWTTSRGWDR
jgi:glycerol-1-phosphatase